MYLYEDASSMGSIENPLLNTTPVIINDIRKLYGLDDPKRLNETIKILEDWVQKQPHLIKKDFSQRFYETAIVTCKGSVERVKKQIDLLCTMKTMVPKFFSRYNVKVELQAILKKVWIIPLPHMSDDYYRLVLFKTFNNDLTPEELLQFFQYILILADYIRNNDYVHGYILIIDYRDLNLFNLITRLTSPDVQPFLNILVKGYGGRMKNLHFITDSKAIEILVSTVKQLLSEKVGQRIQVHKTLEDLYEIVPRDVLPEEYGGKQKSYYKMQAEWVDELSSKKHVEHLKMMYKAGTDESKRHTEKFNEEYMGMPGSFRNLTVD
ncbi:unnamed protein product [Spodoptera littoralis]|uniref:CRAL-TRIO domain-containing protein n=1 Tax=Spodoptera littoralis TaxID=7109 RepID=A0A9P0I6P8_SPOLI|nr:unnamed protein product [Spodoptera littoralis]CAH1640958.1 unnamed protein product [Spodoptera littoralis]